LEHETLGGWSNINIRGYSSGIDFVLKLPWSITSKDANHYESLNDIGQFFSKLSITARPLSSGALSNEKETPFIIFEYIEGVKHNSLLDFSVQDIRFLKDCLQILSSQKPPGLKRYKSPSDFLTSTHSLVENHNGFSNSSQEVGQLIDTFNEIYPEVLSDTDSLGSWQSSTMHGDLWVPNIILQSEKAILLDFEACVYGNQFYDLAYLLESPASTSVEKLPGLLCPDEEDEVNNLRPLAVAFLIDWSLERLLSMESGLMEPNLSTMVSRSVVIDYVRTKISRIKEILY
jgi:aminoglycoside phosphotransferase (APT) family kinase protein